MRSGAGVSADVVDPKVLEAARREVAELVRNGMFSGDGPGSVLDGHRKEIAVRHGINPRLLVQQR